MGNKTAVCRKCGRPLPVGCKYKKCESCRNHAIQGIKKTATIAGGIVCSIGAVVLAIAKINFKDD